MAENGGVIALIVLLAVISIGGFIYCRQKKLSIYKQMGEDCKNDKAYQDVNRGQKVSIIAGIVGIAVVLAMNPFGPAYEEEQEKIFIEWANGVMNDYNTDEKCLKKIKDIYQTAMKDPFHKKHMEKCIKELRTVLSELDEFNENKLSKLKVPSKLSSERSKILAEVVDMHKSRLNAAENLCSMHIEALDKVSKGLEKIRKGGDVSELDWAKEFRDQVSEQSFAITLINGKIFGGLLEVGKEWELFPEKDAAGTYSWVKDATAYRSQAKAETSDAVPKPPATNSNPTKPPAPPQQKPASANSGSTVSMEPKSPEQILLLFHQNITSKDYRKAYHFLSKDFQASAPYDGWAAGFQTTVSSTVSDVKVESQTGGQTVLTYTLKAVDNPGGTNYFRGTAVLVWTDAHGWRIDDITNKPM